MDKIDQSKNQLEQPTEFQTIWHGANIVLNVWLPGALAAICLILGIARWDVVLLIEAGLGGIWAFLGWCFAQAD